MTPLVHAIGAELDQMEGLRHDAGAAADRWFASGGRDDGAQAAIQQQQDAASAAFARDWAQLQAAAPTVAELLRPRPVELATAQKLLKDGEGLRVFFVAGTQTDALLVTREATATSAMKIMDFELLAQVKRLRTLHDATLDKDFDFSFAVPTLDNLSYDAGTAYTLYEQLLAPLQPLLGKVHNLIVVPDGALEDVPLGILVTEKPPQDIVPLDGLATLKWFATQMAISVMPSISSLRALRLSAAADAAPERIRGPGRHSS